MKTRLVVATCLVILLTMVAIAQANHSGPPANDARSSATRIGPGVTAVYTTGATLQQGEPTPCGSMGSTVWFTLDWTGGGFKIDTSGSAFDTALAVYPLGSNTPIDCNDDVGTSGASSLNLSAQTGFYQIQVGGKNGATGMLKLSVLPMLAGDSMQEPIPGVIPTVVQTTNVGMTVETGEIRSFAAGECSDQAVEMANTVWFRLDVMGGLGWVIADTAGSTIDTVMAAYRVDPFTGLVDRTCNDDSSGSRTSQLARFVYPNTVYLFQVGGARGAAGTIRFSVQGQPAASLGPTVTLDPAVANNPDGTSTIYNDKDHDGALDDDEERVPVPIRGTPDPKTYHYTDGSWTLYNDRDHDSTPDEGEESVHVPGPPSTLPGAHVGVAYNLTAGSASVYNDANNNQRMDPGEEIASTPPVGPVQPRVRNEPDGSRTVYNDRDFDGSPDDGEVLAVVPPAPPRPPHDDMSAAKTISAPYAETVLTDNATMETAEQALCGSLAVSVWYKISPTRIQNLIIDGSGSTGGVRLAIYKLDALGNPSLVSCGVSTSTGDHSIGIQVHPGESYLLQVYQGSTLFPRVASIRVLEI